MERCLKRKSSDESMESSSSLKENEKSSKQACVEINLEDLPVVPLLRARIWDYHPNVRVRGQVRRSCIQKGHFLTREHDFPHKNISGGPRRFISAWFNELPTWLEYSIAKDALYCLCCYLFKLNTGEQAGGDCFVSKGFSNWKKERLQGHVVGGRNNALNKAWRTCDALLKQHQARKECKALLGVSIVCMRFLLHQGLIYFGDDEFEGSNNEGVFLGLWNFQCGRHEELN